MCNKTNDDLVQTSQEDLDWALWFMSESVVEARLFSKKPAPLADYARYDEIVKIATSRHLTRTIHKEVFDEKT